MKSVKIVNNKALPWLDRTQFPQYSKTVVLKKRNTKKLRTFVKFANFASSNSTDFLSCFIAPKKP